MHHNFFPKKLPERQIQGEWQSRAIMEMDSVVCRDVLQELQELPDPPSKSKRSGKGHAIRLVPAPPLLDGQRLRDAAYVAHVEDLHSCLITFAGLPAISWLPSGKLFVTMLPAPTTV